MHEGHRKRMKEKYRMSGLSGFAEHEALEFLLFFSLKRVDTNPIAHRLIDRFGSFAAVLEADEKDLAQVEGVGPETALFLKSIPSFGDFYRRSRWKSREMLGTAMETGLYCADLIGELQHEVFYVICLDKNRKILSKFKLAEGSLDHVFLDLRKMTKEILKYPTKAIILTHNHPSGIAAPSEKDRELTLKICDYMENLEIDVIDHIIVCGQTFLSMAQTGLMEPKLSDELARRLSE